MNEFQKNLSPKDVTSICDAAKEAWDKASDRTRVVKFTWKNKKYKSTMTAFRMLVETLNGVPVAARYH